MDRWGGRLLPAVTICVVAGCGYYQAGEVDGEDGPALPSGDASTPAAGDIPCEVASVLSTYCLGCHGDPPTGGAPFPLVTRDDLLAPSSADPAVTVAERALARMQDGSRPMPPSGLPAPSADEIALVSSWVADGMPAGACGDAPGGGDGGGDGGGGGGGGGPQPTTCSSGEYWPENWDDLEQYEDGSPDMNPGRACRSCHVEENDDQAFFFMGTVFPTLHEEDRCYSDVPAGTVVEIIDRNGEVALELEVRARGNFFSTSTSAQVELPFTARVVTPDGATIQMNTPQMTGDCNACHTEQGENGAPGRILLPVP